MTGLILTSILVFLSHTEDYGGQFKQCVYDYRGEPYYVTIPRYKPCPPSIEVDR